jgi:hypothetical protein
MRPIYMTMAAVAALSVATAASAQWGHERTYSHQLRVQIDSGISQGTISRRESIGLRETLGRLVRLERRFSPNGISGREYAILVQRSNALSKDIRVATRNRNGRVDQSAWNNRANNYGNYDADPRFAGLHPADRFSGDARIGQHTTTRIVAMPVQYRSDYVDTDRFYYGYDNGRVYQIDRQSQMILALLDIVRR